MRLPLTILFYIICFSVAAQQAGAGSGLPDDSINALNSLSRDLLDNEPDQAFAFGKQALEAAQQRNFRRGMAEAMVNLGFYYKDQAKYSTSFDYFSNAQQLYRELQDTLMIARTFRHLGRLYQLRGLYKAAEGNYQEALSLAKLTGNSTLMGNTLKDMGGLAYHLKQYKKALNHFHQSLNYIDKETNPADFAAVVNNLGVVHKADSNYSLALSYLLQAYDILLHQNNVRDISPVLMNIGEVHERLGLVDEAERDYLKALAAAKEVNNIQRMVEAYDYLAKFYAMLEDYDEAFMYKSLYASYKDSLYWRETDQQMAKMAKQLELERKERSFTQLIQAKELEILHKENEINRLELYRKNNVVLLSILLLLLAGGGAFILYKSNQGKKEQNIQLAHQNQEISLKNQQLQEVNERLQESEKQLQELNQTKDKFFGILAHDLRSPLVTLKGFVHLLHQGHNRFSAAEMSRLTGKIEQSLNGITSLLDNLLQWSTTQTGLIEFAPRKLKLHKVVDEMIGLLEATAQEKEISLIKNVEEEFVLADKQMLHLIIRNLLGNAIKFTPRGGTVTIGTHATRNATLITVSDTGVGMDKEDIDKLLSSEVVPSKRGTDNEKGSGLGLWLCKEFVERHNGTLQASSEVGAGTTFTVVLPKKQENINVRQLQDQA